MCSKLITGSFIEQLTGFMVSPLMGVVMASPLVQQPHVFRQQKISDMQGAFLGELDDTDLFGWSLAALGDLDGDQVEDVVVGAVGDGDGGSFRGALWILFLDPEGTVKAHQKISDTEGGFTGTLEDSDGFGGSVTCLGDLDGDGVVDVAVGARDDDDGGVSPASRGAVWILFLNVDGTVKAHQKISDLQGGFTGTLDDQDWFGSSVAAIGDHDGDGYADVAVGAMGDHGLEADQTGAVWILFLNPDGTVKGHQKINETQGGFTGDLWDYANFGSSLASLGDLDGDDVGDLAVGAVLDGDFDTCHFPGSVWVLFLDVDGTVKGHRKISSQEGGFDETMPTGEYFGASLGLLGDLDADGLQELAVGAGGDSDGGAKRGAVWILSLAPDGLVAKHWKISDTRGGFQGTLDDEDYFGGFFFGGGCVALVGDLEGDGRSELAVGAPLDDDGGANRGAVWILSIGQGKIDRFTGPVLPAVSLTLPLGAEPGLPGWTGVPVILVGSRSSSGLSRGEWDGELLLDPRRALEIHPIPSFVPNLMEKWLRPGPDASGGMVQAGLLEPRATGLPPRLRLLRGLSVSASSEGVERRLR